jgi:hypothetical protein
MPGTDVSRELSKCGLHHLRERGMDEDRAAHDVHGEARAHEIGDALDEGRGIGSEDVAAENLAGVRIGRGP